jgi:putative FmdB family regulatory protein
MPLYEFQCADCGHVSEHIVAGRDKTDGLTCTDCSSANLNKLISKSNIAKFSSPKTGQFGCGTPERCGGPEGCPGAGGCCMAS